MFKKIIVLLLLIQLAACTSVQVPIEPDKPTEVVQRPQCDGDAGDFSGVCTGSFNAEQLPKEPTFVTRSATGKPRPGIAHLGGAKYKTVMKSSHPTGFAAAIFTNTFGDAAEAVRQLMRTGKVALIKYNLRWSDTHTFRRDDFPAIVQEAKKYSKITQEFPNVECRFSGATEHQLNQRDAQELANKVLAVIPARCQYVNEPWQPRGALLPTNARISNELHGNASVPSSGRYSYSFDGLDAFDVDVTKMKQKWKGAEEFYLWTSQNNGRKNRNDTTPRNERKAYPVEKLIKALAFLWTDRGNVSLPNKYLVKPKSDQHIAPVPESRALKPVFILPLPRGRTIELRHNGKVIIKSSAGEAYNDGRTRFYFGMFGYEIVAKAQAAVLELWFNGKKKGTVNPGFRMGN